ncbi:MAG: transcriptional repressor LexA [Armatimonadetes bacterium]|nr:transcriptional repressor LexA [Armatimonadota bacterium]
MAKGLTARQREMLDAIRNFVMERGYSPSIRDLGPLLGISSLRGVTIHLDALEKKGWITRERASRSIRVLAPMPDGAQQPVGRPVPLLGTIAAGLPLLAVENVESYISVSPEMARPSDELFALRVRGDSMIDDHIADGDIIVVKSQEWAESGQIVAALIDDEATVKRLDTRTKPARLLPANPNYDPIELSADNIRILGRVIGLLRTYQAV